MTRHSLAYFDIIEFPTLVPVHARYQHSYEEAMKQADPQLMVEIPSLTYRQQRLYISRETCARVFFCDVKNYQRLYANPNSKWHKIYPHPERIVHESRFYYDFDAWIQWLQHWQYQCHYLNDKIFVGLAKDIVQKNYYVQHFETLKTKRSSFSTGTKSSAKRHTTHKTTPKNDLPLGVIPPRLRAYSHFFATKKKLG